MISSPGRALTLSAKLAARDVRNRVRRNAPHSAPRPNIKPEPDSRRDHGSERHWPPARREIARDVAGETIPSLGSSDLPQDREHSLDLAFVHRHRLGELRMRAFATELF